MFYTIGEMAKRLHIAPSTLRYYDKEGLLPFVERSEGGIRMFQDSDMEWLAIIECMKGTGMPIKDIKVFIDLCMKGDETIDQRLELIAKQTKAVETQIQELEEHLNLLRYKKWYYETAKQAGSCAVHDRLKDEEVPEEFRKYVRRCKEQAAQR